MQIKTHCTFQDHSFAHTAADIEKKTSLSSWTKTQYHDSLNQKYNHCLSANLINKKFVGFLLFHSFDTSAEILKFAVLPTFQNKGIGKTLFTRMENFLISEKASSIFLEVHEQNIKAIHFYKALGFIPISVRKNYYPHAMSAIIMQKKLS